MFITIIDDGDRTRLPEFSDVMEITEVPGWFKANAGASWLKLENIDTGKPIYEQAGIKYFLNREPPRLHTHKLRMVPNADPTTKV